MTPFAVFCAHWGKAPRKRAASVADVSRRVVSRVAARRFTAAEARSAHCVDVCPERVR